MAECGGRRVGRLQPWPVLVFQGFGLGDPTGLPQRAGVRQRVARGARVPGAPVARGDLIRRSIQAQRTRGIATCAQDHCAGRGGTGMQFRLDVAADGFDLIEQPGGFFMLATQHMPVRQRQARIGERTLGDILLGADGNHGIQPCTDLIAGVSGGEQSRG